MQCSLLMTIKSYPNWIPTTFTSHDKNSQIYCLMVNIQIYSESTFYRLNQLCKTVSRRLFPISTKPDIYKYNLFHLPGTDRWKVVTRIVMFFELIFLYIIFRRPWTEVVTRQETFSIAERCVRCTVSCYISGIVVTMCTLFSILLHIWYRGNDVYTVQYPAPYLVSW